MLSLFLGLLVGLSLGLTGAGGSILAVPLLVLLLGMSVDVAMGLSLLTVATSALFGVVLNFRSGNIVLIPALILAMSGSLLAPLGRLISDLIAEPYLIAGFVVVALIVAIRMWQSVAMFPERAGVLRGSASSGFEQEALCSMSRTGLFELRFPCLIGLSVGGAFIGFVSGLFGVGGGFLIVPLLLRLSLMSYQKAVATSLLVIVFVSSSGFLSFINMKFDLNWILIATLVLGSLFGMFFGFSVAQYLNKSILQRTFSILIVAMSLLMLINKFIFN